MAAYGFEEASGTAATDSGSLWERRHGSPARPGRAQAGSAGALSFDGTNSYVVIADSDSLDLTTGMTLEAWVSPTALGLRARPVVFKAPGDPVYDLHAGLNGRPSARVLVGAREEAAGTGAIPPHLDASRRDLRRRDAHALGQRQPGGDRQPVTGSILGSTGALRLGGSQARDWFRGRIDEVRIYDRALSAGEIAADMQTPVNP